MTETSAAHLTDHPDHSPDAQLLRPTVGGSAAILAACILIYAVVRADSPTESARMSAYILGAGIGASVFFDLRHGLRNLIRVDLLAILALYFLTLFEFLFPQPDFDLMTNSLDTLEGIHLILLGFVGMVVGRHLVPPGKTHFESLRRIEIRPGTFVALFVTAFVLSVFYQWLAVGFNPVAWIEGLTGPRFSQPWQRGRFGGWKELLNELRLLSYILPPIAGIIYARRKDYSTPQLILITVLLLTHMFINVCGGTRNTTAVDLASLVGAYFIIQPKPRIRSMIIAGALTAVTFLFLSHHMLQFRNMGLETYLRYVVLDNRTSIESVAADAGEEEQETFFVDYNLYQIVSLANVFPDLHDYLGWNLPWVALTKPVPRAIWSGKPEGLRISLEEALGVEGMTLSATFIGESYMTGGPLVIVLVGTLLGMFCAWWNRMGSELDNTYGLLIYAVGLFAALITMRSLMIFSTALLPCIALFVFARFLHKNDPA